MDEQWTRTVEHTTGPSRRLVLGTGVQAAAAVTGVSAVVAALVGLTGMEAVASGTSTTTPHRPAAPPRAPHGHAAAPVRTTVATHPTAKHEPLWMSTWDAPIYSLNADVSHRVGVRFPKRAIMLTIDDGPHPLWTPRYLRLLARYDVKATFCVIGEQVRGNEHLLKAAVSDGHHIANHTFHHPLALPSLSPKAIRQELEDTSDAVVNASGFVPAQFRAPGGVWGRDVFAEVARQRMMPLGWDIDPRDWSLPGVDHIRQAMLAARPHDIILCHDGGGDRSQTYQALKTVIPALLARGWTFITLPAPQWSETR